MEYKVGQIRRGRQWESGGGGGGGGAEAANATSHLRDPKGGGGRTARQGIEWSPSRLSDGGSTLSACYHFLQVHRDVCSHLCHRISKCDHELDYSTPVDCGLLADWLRAPSKVSLTTHFHASSGIRLGLPPRCLLPLHPSFYPGFLSLCVVSRCVPFSLLIPLSLRRSLPSPPLTTLSLIHPGTVSTLHSKLLFLTRLVSIQIHASDLRRNEAFFILFIRCNFSSVPPHTHLTHRATHSLWKIFLMSSKEQGFFWTVAKLEVVHFLRSGVGHPVE
ncbi:uncharacterized protein [Physcomitrium patens]|uniref:uncharacterized protein n=1 Tax=Physcomitrium patens TaxID=3218 RepID=UPI003CCDAEB2